MSIREQSAINITDTLKEIRDPKPVLVTRDPFDVEKLAITQFPALLVQQTVEERSTITMGVPGQGRRQATGRVCHRRPSSRHRRDAQSVHGQL